MKTTIYGYQNIVWGSTRFTVSDFFTQFPECTVKRCTHLKSEVIEDGEETYRHRLEGCLFTSMGALNVFNNPITF